ncbi:unnamed protein product [Zymoseptoria tritici ST99CH_1A5]|uniref:GST N-terminal domain-containing protein n=1 Tax=Zymoseptoria tritici ST99CH_1A5 TaxID=1276529 RepID=A0A1Y6LMG8_ZYMTR|nr:unnamed protein product [Zymoseptoria tritici ST99CH_1A5]
MSSEHKPNLTLYTAGTPNGQKISIALEELGLEYKVHHVDLERDEQKEEWFLKLNPNGRIPVLTDHSPPMHPEKEVHLHEGLAILLYLAGTYPLKGKGSLTFPPESKEYWELLVWLSFAQSHLAPMQGQANHFHRYAPEKIQYGIERYQTETKRLYGVLNTRLVEQESVGEGLWLVGGKFTVADICAFSWVNWGEWAGVRLEDGGGEGWEGLRRWVDVIQGREGVKRGVDVPEKFVMKEKMKTKEGEEEFARYHGNWVMKGMEEDREKHKKQEQIDYIHAMDTGMSRSHLLEIPPELRLRIYSYLLTTPAHLIVNGSSLPRPSMPSLLRVNRLLRHEYINEHFNQPSMTFYAYYRETGSWCILEGARTKLDIWHRSCFQDLSCLLTSFAGAQRCCEKMAKVREGQMEGIVVVESDGAQRWWRWRTFDQECAGS